MAVVSWVKASWIIYSFLLVFRILFGPFLFGYIHPDEFFQGGQELFFGCPPTIPWEFEPANALRSVFPPALMTWLPLQIFHGLRFVIGVAIGRIGPGKFSGIEVLVVPRIACSLFSVLVVDRGIWAICNSDQEQQEKAKNGGVPIPVLLLGSAWPTITMMTRPFSNSLESFIFALLMTTVLTTRKSNGDSTFGFFFCWKIGIVCALGIFTRFTFVFFAAPILLFLLSKMIQSFGMQNPILWKKMGWMATSFTFISFGIILADTMFYSMRRNKSTIYSSRQQDEFSVFNHSSLVLTPLNALAYNSNISNLKDHGLHPRWTHAVVNMLIMYGPLTLATYLFVAPRVLRMVARTVTRDNLNRKASMQGDVVMVSAATVLFGLGFLSIAPHQEPRFLLPLLIPLALLGESPIRRFPTVGTCIWVLFNVVLIVLFGILHQGGVTKSLLAIGSTTTWAKQEHPTPWIYMLTYMPPTFLTRSGCGATDHTKICSSNDGKGVCEPISFWVYDTMLDDACQKEKVRIMDLNSSSLEKLQETIQTQLSCSNRREGYDSNSFLYLVVPFLEQIDGDLESSGSALSFRGHQGQFQLSNVIYEWNHVHSFGPHLTTEDFPMFTGSFKDFYDKLALNVYNISCAEINI